jgi:phosphoglycerate dehydrogenase-like enzyme
MSRLFRVGIDPSWGDTFEANLGRFVRKYFDPRDDIQWEVTDPFPGGLAPREVVDRYDGVIILGSRFNAETFEGVERLTCIARWGVGFDAIDIAAANAADVLVALTPDAIKRAVAEAQIALIFALAKRLPDLDRRTRAGLWRQDLPILGVDVVGKTLSSVGLGRIGAEMFKIARGIGFGRLLAYDPYCPDSRAKEVGVKLVDLDTVMAEGDFVTINAFLNSSTRGMIGSREFALMKPSAYFVNTARGPIVQEVALIEALRAGRFAGAGIDVFEQEPPAKDNPLLAMENVIVSPHSMAWTQQGLAGNSRDACRNLLLVASGEVPPCLANPEAAERDGVRAKLARWRSS